MNTKQRIRRILPPLILLMALLGLLLPSATNVFAAAPAQDRWAGAVSGVNGEPLMAAITINGTQVEAKEDGSFELYVPRADDNRYVINAEKFGYVPLSIVHVGNAIEELDLTLQEPERFEIDPEQAIEVKDRRGTAISIPAGSLVDADGKPAKGPLQLFVYTYDLTQEEMVGDMSGINRDGKLVSMESAGAFFAHFSDDEGNKYNLAPDAQAQISIPVDQSARFPDAMPLWSYEKEKGLWIEEGRAVQKGDRYVGEVSHFSFWNFDVEKREPACIQLTVDPVYLALNSPIQVKAVLNSPTRVRYLSITQTENVLINLPANSNVDFYMPPTAPTPFTSVNTGAPWGGTGVPPHPYDKCNGTLHLDGSHEKAAVSGMKFHDLNGNGVKDDGEPGLEGWVISLTDADNNIITTTTDANGNYKFTDLLPGSVALSEGWQAGWVQTYPPTVRHTVVLSAGQEMPNIDFGNTQPCENPTTETCLAGRKDNFDRNDGSEPASPSQELLDWANRPNVLSEFDVLPTDKLFLHTFGESDTDTCLSGDCLIVGAKLTLSLKGGRSSLAYNDGIGFVQDGQVVWYQSIANLNGGSWGPGQAATITLDLANLPIDGRGVTNVLAALQDGKFDFYIQDDTGVDFAELEVEKCCGDCTPPPPDMVAWWHLDEMTGTLAADIAMYANDGRHINTPTPVTGKVAGALSFNGSNQYVEVPDHSEINFGTDDLSIDAWIKTTDRSGVKVIVDKRYEDYSGDVQGYSIFLDNGELGFQLADGNGSWTCSTASSSSCTNYGSNTFVADGKWHLVAVTVERDDPTGGKFYVDGVQVATFSPTIRSGSLDNNKPLRIGSRSSFETGLFKGAIDEVELFNRVLKEEEIKAIYDAGSAGKCKCIEEEETFEAGVVDEFSTSNGTEPTYRSPGLDAHITYASDANFDKRWVNGFFGQTFQIPITETRCISDAWLEIRVKPLGELDRNDSIGLHFIDSSGQQAIAGAGWGRYFGSGNASAGLFPSVWGSSLTPVTINLHLSQLPMADGSVKDIVPILDQLRYLDVMVQDDTAVDYVKLTVAYCCDEKKALYDFGDAPDSTNHFTSTMKTYGGTVQANFPTVFDGDPVPGPKHIAPKAEAWLGEAVSLEQDADLFDDYDTVNNIYPPANVADRDWFDDGVAVDNLALPECGTTVFTYTVNSVGTLSDWYVNAWFDFNQDGDWEDTFECEANGRAIAVREWAVQDQSITVTPAGGLQSFTTPTFAAMASPEREMWMRVTLSEKQADAAGDGRGLANGFEYGETEDYLLPPQRIEACDLAIRKTHNGNFVAGQNGSYTIVVTNIGSTDCDPTIQVQDLLPTGLTYVSASGSGWSCSNSGATVTCDYSSSLAPSASSNINLTVSVDQSAIPAVTNCAAVQNPDDVNLMNNEGCDQTEVVVKGDRCDLSIDKRHRGDTFYYDRQGVYNLAVSNMGAEDCRGPIEVSDTLPQGMSVPWTSTTINGWTCTADSLNPQTITCSHPGPLPATTSLPLITLTVNVPDVGSVGGSGWDGDIAENCAKVGGPNDSDSTNNNSCDQTIGILPPPGGGISLVPGWNLISVPVQPTDTDISQVLASIAGNYDLVYAYDACDVSDQWKNFNPSAPPFANDLTDVDETMGLWIHMTAADTLTVSGTTPSTTDIPLCEGWNLVGYPSTQVRTVPDALASISGAYDLVYGYEAADTADPWASHNPNSPPFANDLTEMGPGWGYWIDANQDATWTVNN